MWFLESLFGRQVNVAGLGLVRAWELKTFGLKTDALIDGEIFYYHFTFGDIYFFFSNL